MHEALPSRTALRVALRRAAHQIHDARPLVFDDPLAVRVLGPEERAELARTPDKERRPFSAALRAFMVARARLAEDTLAEGVAEHGVRQYLVLGAGLDTFAYRNPYSQVRVFEVDHPATQAWKRERLEAAGIAVPENARLVAVDFERESSERPQQVSGEESHALARQLQEAGFDPSLPTVTAWLGVVPYLTREAFRSTLRFLGSFAPGSRVVFDYCQPREVLPPIEQLMLDSLADRVALANEPFRLFFTPDALEREVRMADLRVLGDLGREVIAARFFAGRSDGLTVLGEAARLCCLSSRAT